MNSNRSHVNSVLYQHHDEMELGEILFLDTTGHQHSKEDQSSNHQQFSGASFSMFDSQSNTVENSLGVSDMVLQLITSSGQSDESSAMLVGVESSVLQEVNHSHGVQQENTNRFNEFEVEQNGNISDPNDDENQYYSQPIHIDNVCNERLAVSNEDSSHIDDIILTWNSVIPESILKLFSLIRSNQSDWAFVHTISAQMCQDFMPMDCLVSLKQGLLLSLASIQVFI